MENKNLSNRPKSEIKTLFLQKIRKKLRFWRYMDRGGYGRKETSDVVLRFAKSPKFYNVSFKVVLLMFIWMFLLSSTSFAESLLS